jgi:UDP-2,3-diacylglucosamine hydrolase
MIEAVFISDLHLHPEMHEIQARFDAFINWAKSVSVKKIYILGDFFHAWPGDDAIDNWSHSIAGQLKELSEQGIQLFYMHGNRDFLLGQRFAQLAGFTILLEPTLIQLGKEPVLLVHGDGYCTRDVAHQRFRKLTRNRLFSWCFLHLPLSYRMKLVNKVREMSQISQNKTMEHMDVVSDCVTKHMIQFKVTHLIHGHTHKPGLTSYFINNIALKRYVLSDWDDNPLLLCYDNTMGLYFNQMLDLRG